jgi:hypothetical protein
LSIRYGGASVVNAAPLLPANWTAIWTTITVEINGAGLTYYSSSTPGAVTHLGSVVPVSTAGAMYYLSASYISSTSSGGWIRDIEFIGMALQRTIRWLSVLTPLFRRDV